MEGIAIFQRSASWDLEAAADFTNLVGSVEQGYTAIAVVEDTLAWVASHLSQRALLTRKEPTNRSCAPAHPPPPPPIMV